MRFIVFAALFCVAAAKLQLSDSGSWTYDAQQDWPGMCRTGKRQSPIDIRSGDVQRVNMTELRFHNYDSAGQFCVTATGKTVRVHGFNGWKPHIPYLDEGGLDGRYYLEEVQFHWYRKDERRGSEHSIDGTHYPIEIQLVHVGKIEGRKRIAVLAVFVKPYEPEPNEEASANGLNSLLWMIEDTDRPRNTIIVGCGLDNQPQKDRTRASYQYGGADMVLYPKHLLPEDRSRFYRYEGSLTTPNCHEKVTWTVMEVPLEIPDALTAKLTNLRNGKTKRNEPPFFVHNQRAQQDLNGRRVILRDPNATTTSIAASCRCVFWPLAIVIAVLLVVDVQLPDGNVF